MLDLFREIENLIATDAVHVRSGVSVNETSDDLLMCLLYREVAELDTARMPHRKASELDELGDILTVVARYAIRKGFSPADIESAAIRKIAQRYDRRVAEVHVEGIRRSRACCIAHLVRRGHGVMSTDGKFITGGHCTDGARVRCGDCGQTWVHVCDEAEGCSWQQAQSRKKKSAA